MSEEGARENERGRRKRKNNNRERNIELKEGGGEEHAKRKKVRR